MPGITYRFEFNSHGFRTPEFSQVKKPGSFRVLNVGDSIVFGWSVPMEKTYGQLLEKQLNRSSKPGQEFEVINAGVPAWNLNSERNFLVQEGLSYQPDLVILDVTVLNDIYGGGFNRLETSPVQWLKDNTYTWFFLTTNIRFLIAKKAGPEAIPSLNPPLAAEAYFPLSEDSPVYKRTIKYIREIYQACEERDIPFLLVIFPTAYQVNSMAHPDVPQRLIMRWAQKEKINAIDLLPTLKQICEDDEPGACEGYENLLFADVWMHPNPFGQQIVADQIQAVLQEKMTIIP